ncbi:MAG: hypothetical protein ABW128_06270 [Rhizorhabdus sp.]
MIEAIVRNRCLASLLALLVAGCGGADDTKTLEARSRASQQAVGLTLPASARVKFVHQMHGIDDAAQIIAVMPTADWQALERRIETTAPGTQPLTRDGIAFLGTDNGDWQPSKQPGLTARQVPWRGGVESLNIGAATAGPGMVRVFIFWFQM